MSHTIFHTPADSIQLEPTPPTTVEAALRRRRAARRTILSGESTPVAARQDQPQPSATEERFQERSEGVEQQERLRSGSRLFEEAGALDILSIAAFSTDPLVQAGAQAGSFLGGINPIAGLTLGLFGAVGGGAARLTQSGSVLGIPFTGSSLVGRGGGRASRVPTGMLGGRSELSPFESQTLDTQISISEQFERSVREQGIRRFGGGDGDFGGGDFSTPGAGERTGELDTASDRDFSGFA